DLTVTPEDEALRSPAEARRVLDERLEDRLEIERRPADRFEDLSGGGLLRQGLGQVAVAGLQLLEQTHVLDGDDSLIGEGLEQRDLLVGEWVDFGQAKLDHNT